MIEHLLDRVAMVLVMSVEPGFGGQAFIPEVMPKIAALRKMLDERGLKVDIEVDGNAGPHNAAQLIHAGTTVLVGGTAAVFRQGMSIADATREFRQAIDAASS
jgi:ribulose-phosphate 3-epimerase